MIENLNNPNTTPKNEVLPANEEVRVDLHKSNLISLEQVRRAREASRLAYEANPPVEVETSTPDQRIQLRGTYVLMARRGLAAASRQQPLTDLKKAS
jgi:hypothetical protein